MEKVKKIAAIVALQIGIAVFAVLLYLAWDADKIYELLSGDVSFVEAEQPCDLHSAPCSATLEDGSRVTFSITPRPIPVMETLTFSVEAEGLQAENLRVDLYGTDMNMGRYSYRLERNAAGGYQAEGMIPSCIPGMTWRSDLIVETPMKRYGTYFTFSTR